MLSQLANSVVPDQTAPEEQSGQGLHCLFRQVCQNIFGLYGMQRKLVTYTIVRDLKQLMLSC